MNQTDILGYIVILFFVVSIAFVYSKKTDFELKCIISGKNGNTFCVRERNKIQEAADLLARVTDKATQLVNLLNTKYPDKDSVKRLVDGYNPNTIKETLPNSKHTAYTENKKQMSFCLNVKKNDENGELIDEHTLMFVTLHEMAHISCKSIGHKSEFWENFRFLLEEAKIAGIHEPVDYSKEPKEYCSQKINDNPYFELQK